MKLTMNNFLPDNYSVPKAPSDYCKLEDGKNKLRILSAPIMGYEYWTKDNKPVRSKDMFEGTPEDAKLDKITSPGKADRYEFRPKHFWAMVVWNYKESRVQILEITQASIQGPIQDLALNEDWGDPRNYDITITKSGKLLDTEYSVIPSPQTQLLNSIKAAHEDKYINLEALYEGNDPFERQEVTRDDTPFS